jgi:hypothetical protein
MLNPGKIADVIDVVLFRYNYIDSRLYNLCKTKAVRKNSDGSIVVSYQVVNAILNAYFEKEVLASEMMPVEVAYKSATTIYFLKRLFSEMPNIKWVKLSLNKNRIYSRITDQQDLGPTIKFTFKIIHCTLRLHEVFEEEDLKTFNRLIEPLNLFKDKPYTRIKAVKLLDKVESILATMGFEQDAEVLAIFLDLFDAKLESDNPDVLLVTDY